ncbi:hypothetical protein AURANDRAFT_69441 [Aureococcus anophagefferens]|uniref:Uncharacterized protein n=1 Tax=Aureococcus anophagefferens TaxID=44056 RepID=F0YSR6_AURAN|nr:hypothetical protein AURANDRAFT_69441 [Aureococcus anophagefferens]EGB01843.1 hypothetical protein AURANDRAFT_69441 [Aureococcus anophagefferens]|eukprot:XP_009043457.1 hypothetical protein AURANDRAFT_69441 [Aureococcus anophagefferens]
MLWGRVGSKADAECEAAINFLAAMPPAKLRPVQLRPARVRARSAQPLVAPAVDSLVGKRIEYLEWVDFPDGGEAMHWFAGVVKQVSDGTVRNFNLQRRKDPPAKACYQASSARILWDAQPAFGEHEPTESWVALRPNKFNGDRRSCWRLDLD